MTETKSSLVIVAYPSDEVLGFTSVCEGSDVVAVSSGCRSVSSETLSRQFQQAATALGVRQAFYFDLSSEDRFPEEALENKLRAMKPYRRVYTHSPFDDDAFRANTTPVASKVFGSIWIQATGTPPMETHVLAPDLFQRKMEAVNTFYAEYLRLRSESGSLPHTALSGVEAFTEVSHDEVIRAVAVSTNRVMEFPDFWGFRSSSYEQQRFSATCELLVKQVDSTQVENILEVGACEGEMTQRLRLAFPSAAVTAVEAKPFFVQRLRERFAGDEMTSVLESRISDIPLVADLIVLTELLYYLDQQELQDTLERLRAKYVLIGCDGEFEVALSQVLQGRGWRNLGSRRIPPRFEPVDGGRSHLICCRQGTNVRLWKKVTSQ